VHHWNRRYQEVGSGARRAFKSVRRNDRCQGCSHRHGPRVPAPSLQRAAVAVSAWRCEHPDHLIVLPDTLKALLAPTSTSWYACSQ